MWPRTSAPDALPAAHPPPLRPQPSRWRCRSGARRVRRPGRPYARTRPPRREHTDGRRRAAHVPVCAYEFADREAPVFLLLPGGFEFGACHAGDIPCLLEHRFAGAQRRLSAVMVGYWAAFGRTGIPRGPGLPQWPPYRTALPAGRPYTVDYAREHRLGFWARPAPKLFGTAAETARAPYAP
ncbi:carboxylesterase family protein [Streptomyces sp. NPDC047014]|uniref:carboxylesterase family protein n=1 Tax=Streptomyces sp. NPDC047014 TaxID=3155736 RepID=UPI0033CACF67